MVSDLVEIAFDAVRPFGVAAGYLVCFGEPIGVVGNQFVCCGDELAGFSDRLQC